MIEKIISIRNVGKFSKLQNKAGGWDGVFKKSNIIYAPNGSGKTTLSMIFQSIGGSINLIKKKDTFSDMADKENPGQYISCRVNGKTFEYKNENWTEYLEKIDVFNVHFIEDNLFYRSQQLQYQQLNLFSVLSDFISRTKNREINDLREKKDLFSKQIEEVKRKAKKREIDKQTKNSELQRIRNERTPISNEIYKKNRELGLHLQKTFEKFTEKVNVFLAKFSTSMRLEKISRELNQRTTFYLKFGENRVTFDSRMDGHEFRYTLSEGDKNALSISVFLAKLSFIEDPEQWTIVFDDPLTSLDSGRRYLTIKELSKISQRFGQLIVLTHDAGFAADLEKEIVVENVSLELISSPSGSQFSVRNHSEQHITSLFRDINTLTEFKKNGAYKESDQRDVIRCLRPILEGLVRVKYFDRLEKKQWLGDFIKLIRDSKVGDDLFRMKPDILERLCDVNDYSKRFHHAAPGEPDQSVDEQELFIMVESTLKLIKEI